MDEPLFPPRRAASIIKQHLIEQLASLQERIMLVERFGTEAVTFAKMGIMGTEKLPEMLARHAEYVAQIKALTRALDAASDAELRAFVQSIIRDRGKQ